MSALLPLTLVAVTTTVGDGSAGDTGWVQGKRASHLASGNQMNIIARLCLLVLLPVSATSARNPDRPECSWVSPAVGLVNFTMLQMPATKCWGGGPPMPGCLESEPYMTGCKPPKSMPHLSTWVSDLAKAATSTACRD